MTTSTAVLVGFCVGVILGVLLDGLGVPFPAILLAGLAAGVVVGVLA